MTIRTTFSLLALAAFGLAGCTTGGTSGMDTGQRIAERGEAISEYGTAWSSGQATVAEGRAMVESSTRDADQAERRIATARADIAREETRLRDAQMARLNGERMIADGTAQMRRAEADYTNIRTGPAAN